MLGEIAKRNDKKKARQATRLRHFQGKTQFHHEVHTILGDWEKGEEGGIGRQHGKDVWWYRTVERIYTIHNSYVCI